MHRLRQIIHSVTGGPEPDGQGTWTRLNGQLGSITAWRLGKYVS